MSSALRSWLAQHGSTFSGSLAWEEPLSRHTYYRIGGPAEVVASPKSLDDLRLLQRAVREIGTPFFVLGLGSNLLVSDEGYRGLVIKAARLNLEIEAIASDRIRTGGSVAISTLLRRAAHEGWGGLEFLSGVPGSIGGAVFMNAGTHLGETKDRLRKIEVFPFSGTNGELVAFAGEELKYQYRKNLYLPAGSLVWGAEWEIAPGTPAEVKRVIDETLARRKATQPVDYPSCGSVFKNPKAHGISAWQVIDKLGLRGHRVGGAQISEKHSNFIVNHGTARAEDVRALIALVKARALAELGVPMEEEVLYLGFATG